MHPAPDWVFLDAGGTLLSPEPSVGAVYARAGAAHGLPDDPAGLDDAFRVAWGRADRGRPPRERWGDEAGCRAFWRALVEDVFDQIRYPGDRESCFAAVYAAFERPEAWHVPPDVRPALRELQARGLVLGVISNWDHRLPALLDRLGLAPFFALIVASADGETEKPDPAFFTDACRRAGVDPARALHVGDRRDLDVEPARAAGLTAWLIDRADADDGPDRLRRLTDIAGRLPL